MKKFYTTVISAIMIIISITAFSITSFGSVGANGYSDAFGNKRTEIISLPTLGKNTYLGSVTKAFNPTDYPYSKVGINPNGSTVNKMNIWLCSSSDGSGVKTAKYQVLPDGNLVQLNYKYTNSFSVGSSIYYLGEQNNIHRLDAKVVMYSY